jgi:hypothetical protein
MLDITIELTSFHNAYTQRVSGSMWGSQQFLVIITFRNYSKHSGNYMYHNPCIFPTIYLYFWQPFSKPNEIISLNHWSVIFVIEVRCFLWGRSSILMHHLFEVEASKAVPHLRRWAGVHPRSVHVIFVVDRVALGRSVSDNICLL